ncbi:GNAT family N-acetyltransferase [Microbispora siamensis]
MSLHVTHLVDPHAGGSGRRLAWLVSRPGGVPAGSAYLRLFTVAGDEYLAELDLHVHPAERRAGVGSRLLAAALAAAREEGRRCVTAEAEAGAPGDAQHYGTGVLPEHRGRGLGRWMKAEMIRLVRERHPDLGGLLADTADGNTYMRGINDALGYVPTHRTVRFRLDL